MWFFKHPVERIGLSEQGNSWAHIKTPNTLTWNTSDSWGDSDYDDNLSWRTSNVYEVLKQKNNKLCWHRIRAFAYEHNCIGRVRAIMVTQHSSSYSSCKSKHTLQTDTFSTTFRRITKTFTTRSFLLHSNAIVCTMSTCIVWYADLTLASSH